MHPRGPHPSPPLRAARFATAATLLLALARAACGYTLTSPGAASTEPFTSYDGAAAPPEWTLNSYTGSPVYRGLDNGGGNSGGFRSYGDTTSADRALGYLGSATAGTNATFTAYWTNATGATVTDLTLSYRGERWRVGERTSQVTVAYSVNNGAFVTNENLTFRAPSTGTPAATPGNDTANSTTLVAQISGLNLGDGETLAVRWNYFGGGPSGNRQGLAIDDISLTPGGAAVVRFAATNLSFPETAGTTVVWVTSFGISNATAQVHIAGGDAGPVVDFTLPSTTLVFTAGSPSQALVFVVLDDTDPEPIEYVTLALTNVTGAATAPGAGSATIAIVDNERPLASFAQSSATAGEAGPPLEVAVVLSFAADATVRLGRAGTAVEGDDYNLSGTTFVFAATSAPSASVTLTPVDDMLSEPPETVLLSLEGLDGANPGAGATSTVTILDNEAVARFAAPSLVTEEGQTGVVIRIEMSTPADATVRVSAAGFAQLGPDFTLSATTAVFSAGGPTSVTITADIVADGLPEGPERATLMLQGDSGAGTGTNGTAQIVVRDGGTLSIMSANITSGSNRKYEDAGQRIFKGLLPDIVAIQEFTPTAGTHRAFVDANFGTAFHFYVETEFSDAIPNGIVSRWPITASGEWTDTTVSDRDFAWATVDIPGSRDLHVVSVHLYASGTAADRADQAQSIVNQIQANFPPDSYIVVAGDLNTQDRSEQALTALGAAVSDVRQPADQFGDKDTSLSRTKPLDYVLPNAPLDAVHRTVTIDGMAFPEGAVFDSRLWTSPPSPVLTGDSGAVGMQHMAVMKLFELPTGIVLSVTAAQILDLGDGDGLIETGETARFFFRLKNDGSVTATGIVLTAATTSAFLSLTGSYAEAIGTVLPGQTVTSQTPCDVQVSPVAPAGEHPLSMTVTNGGYVATTTLFVPVFIDRIAEALDTTDLIWTFTGQWELQTNVTLDGVDALRNDYVTALSTVRVQTVVTGPGQISFAWRYPATGTRGYMGFRDNGSLRSFNTGSNTWVVRNHNIGGGIHTLRWEHVNWWATPIFATAILDQVSYTLFGNPVLSVNPAAVTSTIMIGSPPQSWTVTVQNIGSGSLDYTASVAAAWASISPTLGSSTGELDFLTLTVNPTNLPAGPTSASVRVAAVNPAYGAATSWLYITIVSNIGPAVTTNAMTWRSGGGASWFQQTNVTHDGVSAARSGAIGDNGLSWVSADVAGPGSVSFWWKVSSEQNFDFLQLRVNGALTTNRISGEVDWQLRTLAITAGLHTIRWEYAKDGSVADGQDAAWLDEVTYAGRPDRDADLLPDDWELLYFGSATGASPAAFSDGDALSDLEEFIADTDPTNSLSTFERIASWSLSGSMLLEFPMTSTARVYEVTGSTNLESGAAWVPAAAAAPGTGSNLLIGVTNAAPELFLRGGVRLP